jgi:hypothetical protein
VQQAAADLIAAAAAIHLYIWFDFFHWVHVVRALFLLNAAAGALIALALAASNAVPVLLIGVGYAATTVASFVISTQWGLFGYHERFWGRWQSAPAAIEFAAIRLLFALMLARSRVAIRERIELR